MSGHLPVMLNEVIAALAPRDGARYVDGTFGGGGYARAILEAADCTVLGIDRDPEAIARFRQEAKAAANLQHPNLCAIYESGSFQETPFLVMALVLIVRPHGLFGTPASAHGAPTTPEAPLRLLDNRARIAVAAVLGAALIAPLLGDDFLMVLLIEILIAILFAASLHLVMGLGGMASFGHAAFFGLSAYAAAILFKQLGFGMTAAMLVAPLVSAAAAMLFGWFFVRLSGVYLAMLTLAAAQIIWGVVFQWKSVSGGDDGIRGIWPTGWASDKRVYYYLTLAIVILGLWLIRRFAFSRLGWDDGKGKGHIVSVAQLCAEAYTHRMTSDWEEDGDPWRVNSVRRSFENSWLALDEHAVTRPDGSPGTYTVVRIRRLAVGVLPISLDLWAKNSPEWTDGRVTALSPLF